MDILVALAEILDFIVLIPQLLWTILNILPIEISRIIALYLAVLIAILFWKAK